MINDKDRLYDVMRSAIGGVDSGSSPEAIGANQVAWLINGTFRGEFVETRPPWSRVTYGGTASVNHLRSGRFQGAGKYSGPDGQSSIIMAKGGRLYRFAFEDHGINLYEITITVPQIVTVAAALPAIGANFVVDVTDEDSFTVGDTLVIDGGTYTVVTLLSKQLNLTYVGGALNDPIPVDAIIYKDGLQVYWEDRNADDEFAFVFQAKTFALVGQGQHLPIIYNGSYSRRATPAEIPPFYCGAEVQGRIWFAFPNRQVFGATNLVGSVGVTKEQKDAAILIYAGPDAENTYLNEGGEFSVPPGAELITSISTTAMMDTSLGHGPVMVNCTNGVFTCQAPVDRTIWKDLTYPIQTVALFDYGSLSARAVVNANSDLWYRSEDGFRSFILARQEFSARWSNTSMSGEMKRLLDYDTRWLLHHTSGVLFDNRLLMTCGPHLTEGGVVFSKLAVLNFDGVSTLQRRTNPAWEGEWTTPSTGVFQIIRMRVEGQERCFALCPDELNGIELWELLRTGTGDVNVVPSGNTYTMSIAPIDVSVEMRAMSFRSPTERHEVICGDLAYDTLHGEVDFTAYLRTDQYPGFMQWANWQECFKTNVCDTTCPFTDFYEPGYNPSHVLPRPADCCLPGMEKITTEGHAFQVKLDWSGKARLKWFRLHGKPVLEDDSPTPAS